MDLYTYINPILSISHLTKKMIIATRLQGYEKAKQLLKNRLYNIYRIYNQLVQQRLIKDKSIVQQNMDQIILLCLAMLKNTAFKQANNIRVDYRASIHSILLSANINLIQHILTPKLYAIHLLQDNDGLYDNNRLIQLPTTLALNIKSITNDGIYLIDNGLHFILRIGDQVSNHILSQIIDINNNTLQIPSNNDSSSLTNRFHNILQSLRNHSQYYQQLTIIYANQPADYYFFEYLIEERTQYELALNEFYADIKRNMLSAVPSYKKKKKK